MAQKTVKVMFIGDVVGTPGLQMVGKMLKSFISKYSVDFVICNGENCFIIFTSIKRRFFF